MINTYETAAKRLAQQREALISNFLEGKAPDFIHQHSRVVDNYFLESFEKSMVGPRIEMIKNPYAIIALGGYGREEQCTYSDVDVLFLFKKAIPREAEALVREIIYPLWDLGLEVGHATRSLKECISLAAEDIEVFTSILDARFICGMSPLYSLLLEQLRKKLLTRGSKKMVMELVKTTRARHHVCGDASYLLEPDIKDGQGGLRDYHTLLWLARIKSDIKSRRDLEFHGYLSHEEYREFSESLDFLWDVRSRLHTVARRKCDRLHFEYQQQLAQILDYKEKEGKDPVELFLGTLHGKMERIKQQSQLFLYEIENAYKTGRKVYLKSPKIKGLELKKSMMAFSSPEQILKSPELLIKIFEQSARNNIPLGTEARRIVKDFLHLVDKDFRQKRANVKSFETTLSTRVPDFDILGDMLHTGFLFAFIPEFRQAGNLIEFDEYHHYPVDKHSLRTVEVVKNFGQEEDVSKDQLCGYLFSELREKKLLFWAALLHDIGKGCPNEDHSQAGAEMARKILKEKGYGKDEIDTVAFLIREHLTLAKTATRRDIGDEETAIGLAREIEEENRLKMLYLLTVADMIATGKGIWNDWTLSLLRDLFLKVLRILKKGELATREAFGEVAAKKEAVLNAIFNEKERKNAETLFQSMSPRYLLYTSAEEIREHARLHGILRDQPLVWNVSKTPGSDTRTVTICAKDAPGLFAKITGVFALNNLDILGAQAYTWKNAVALDIFQVRPPLDKLFEAEKWATVEKDLNAALSDQLSLIEALDEKINAGRNFKPHECRFSNRINIDNEATGFFTIIEVYTYDAPALLFRLSHALHAKCNLDVWIAKVATHADQVVDIFYVRDQLGQKIDDPEQLEAITDVLHEVLPEMESECMPI